MLEEALSSNTRPPADTALALLSYVRYELPAGGANAEARFFLLFSLLCDRLFGPMSGEKEAYRHEVGGWLSRNQRWSRPNPPSSRSPLGSGSGPSASQSIDFDPVVQLLAGLEALPPQKDGTLLPTLIEAISAEAEHRPGIRFPFPLHALSKPTQDVIMALIQAAMAGKPVDSSLRGNAARLFGSLLLVSPQDQGSLKTYQQKQALKEEKKQPLSISPGRLSLKPTASFPPSSSSTKEQSEVQAKLMLSMLEFYLFAFIRYPLAAPVLSTSASQMQVPSPNATVSTPRASTVVHYNRRPASPYGEQVYLQLFRGYLKHFLAFEQGQEPFIGFSSLTRESELFLRIAIEFWFEGAMVIPTNSQAFEAIQKRRIRASAVACSSQDVSLAMSYDLLDVKYQPPPLQVQRCLRSLVNHVVKHPDIPRASADFSEVTRSRAATGQSGASCHGDYWCLTPSMTILQLPFYNFVRTTFRYASVHVGPAPFQTAFDSWLVWLEPWNIEMRKKNAALANAKTILQHRVSTSPRQNQMLPETTPVIILPKPASRSKYSKKWEPYIAANLHLYTVPLAIFLRRARELDFSPNECRRSLTLVQRVMRVFSPEVVCTINSLLSNNMHPLSRTVTRHERVLGEYSPSTFGPLSLESCKDDMHNLLEEIYSTHMKAMRELDLFDRLASYLGLGDVTASEERELKALFEQAKVIVNFPAGYEVIPAERMLTASKSESEKDERSPERQGNGLLTEKGVEQLVTGTVRCSSLDFAPQGDQLHSRVKSYEISQLVPLTIKMSDWINERTALAPQGSNGTEEVARKTWFRINLRFLADYRTILWISLLSWLWSLFR